MIYRALSMKDIFNSMLKKTMCNCGFYTLPLCVLKNLSLESLLLGVSTW